MIATSRLSSIHTQILRQHVEIRARLRGIEHLAKTAGKSETRHHLQLSLAHFAAVFEQHLAFEERELLPLVKDVDAWGPVRASAMLEEHAEQRKRIERIVAYADAPDIGRTELQGEVTWLSQSLKEDMEHEETELSKLEQLDSTPQMTG